MGIEIERKFLVKSEPDSWRQGRALRLTQGYLAKDKTSVVRVRVTRSSEGEEAWLTIKGPTAGATRAEYEYPIPVSEAREMLDTMCDSVIDKTRYLAPEGQHTWEVDEFHGANDGLIVAEIELDSEDEAFSLPPWAGQEVTDDSRYYNSSLSSHPFCDWGGPSTS